MKKPLAIIEISSSKIKLLVSSVINNEPIIVYRTTRDITGAFVDGKIADKSIIVKALMSLKTIVDDSARIKLNINEVNLVLPCYGLTIFQTTKTTTTVSANAGGSIAQIDIENVINQVKNENIPENLEVVEVAPSMFFLEDGTKYSSAFALIGAKSSRNLTVNAFLHCLPKGTKADYDSMLTEAGFRVLRNSVQPYAEASLFKTNQFLPGSYILLDFGDNNANVSLIGKGMPYASTSFYIGGEHLAKAISEEMGIPSRTAFRLMVDRGFDPREISYDPPLVKKEESSNSEAYFQKDLNLIITSFFDEDFLPRLDAAISTLAKNSSTSLDSMPIIITGGMAQLNNISSFFTSHYLNREIFLGFSKVVGGRDPSFTPLLGMTLISSSFQGSLTDHEEGYSSIRREEKPVKAAKEKSSSLDDKM